MVDIPPSSSVGDIPTQLPLNSPNGAPFSPFCTVRPSAAEDFSPHVTNAAKNPGPFFGPGTSGTWIAAVDAAGWLGPRP